MVVPAAIPGSVVRSRLQETLTQATQRLQQARSRHDEIGQRISQLIERRKQTFSQLARAQLPALTPTALANVLEAARSRLQAVYVRHEQVRQAVAEQLSQLERAIDSVNREIERREEELSRLTTVQHSLEQQVAARLAADPEFRTASEAALAAEVELQRNEERLKELNAESQTKLPPYERSVLFQYLYRKGYRRSSQAAHTLTGRLDRWVARLIHYDTAIRSYEFLKLTPPRMAAELQRRQDEFSRLMATVENFRDRVSHELGLDAVSHDVQGHVRQKEALIDQIGRQQAESHDLRKEHQQLEAGLGRFHEEALQQLQQILAETRQEVLDREAERTVTAADDQLVAELAGLTADLQRLHPEALESDKDVREAETTREELVVALRRFDDNAWSQPQVSFQTSLDLDGLVRGLSTGSLNRHEVSQRLQRAVQVEKSMMERTAEGALAVAMAPETRVLAEALLQVAGAVLEASATRSVSRRSSGGSSGSRSGGGGGFSSGSGF